MFAGCNSANIGWSPQKSRAQQAGPAVIAVEDATQLVAVNRIVRGVEIQHDAFGGAWCWIRKASTKNRLIPCRLAVSFLYRCLASAPTGIRSSRMRALLPASAYPRSRRFCRSFPSGSAFPTCRS